MSNYPNPIEHRFDTGHGELCWFEWGQAGDPAILLLHATGFHGRCWDGVVRHLPAGLRIIAPDFRGHGRSYRPKSMADWHETAADIGQLIAALDVSFAVAAGHSMGGACLVHLAALMPERFDRLLLVDPVIMIPSYYENPPDPAAIDPSEHMIARRRNQWPSPDAMFESFSTRHPYSYWQSDVLHDYCTYGLVDSVDGLELGCPPRLEASVYMGSMIRDPWPDVVAITCPVTVMRATPRQDSDVIDFATSPTEPTLASRFVQGEDRFYPELTHFIPMQAPEMVAFALTETLDKQG